MIIEKHNIENPLISVVIPIYKEEKILESTLVRYTNDIRKKYNIELIVSDGGSKDKSVKIAEKYADKIFIHTEQRRQTIPEGRNKGAELAKGKVIVFINGDTYPENVDTFFDFITKWINDCSYCGKYPALATRVFVPENDVRLSDKIFYNFFNHYVAFLNIIGIGMGRGECQIVTKEIFEKVGGYNATLPAGEDFDLFRRIAKIAKTQYVSQITVIESPRRFRKIGYLKVLYNWTINGLSVMLSGKAKDKEWEAIR